jgi:hypothetical protein
MARHRDAHDHAFRIHIWIHFLKPLGSNQGLVVVRLLAVRKCKQTLPHRVAKGHLAAVYKSDFFCKAP